MTTLPSQHSLPYILFFEANSLERLCERVLGRLPGSNSFRSQGLVQTQGDITGVFLDTEFKTAFDLMCFVFPAEFRLSKMSSFTLIKISLSWLHF